MRTLPRVLVVLLTLLVAAPAIAGPGTLLPPVPIVVPVVPVPIGTTGGPGDLVNVPPPPVFEDGPVVDSWATVGTQPSPGTIRGLDAALASVVWMDVCSRLGTENCEVLAMCLNGTSPKKIAATMRRQHRTLWKMRRGRYVTIEPTAKTVKVALRTRIARLLENSTDPDVAQYGKKARLRGKRDCRP